MGRTAARDYRNAKERHRGGAVKAGQGDSRIRRPARLSRRGTADMSISLAGNGKTVSPPVGIG
jgi:hypothetical protein